MTEIQQLLPGKLRTARKYTEAEYEAARRQVMQRNSICDVDCPICGGIGYIAGENGKVDVCPNVDPLKLYPGERYGLDLSERDWTWAKIEAVNNTLAGAEAVRETMQRGWGWIYLWGPPGLGKTLILKIAVAEYLRSKKAAAYTRMAEILDDLRAAFDAQNPSEESQNKLDWWAGLPLLAIDEFDRVRTTPYADERKFLLMDRRYEQALREKSITLMTSNSDPALLDNYLFDRIQDGRFAIIHVEGDSYRIGAS